MQSSPVFLPEESHGQRSLVGYSSWGRKELDTTEEIWHPRRHSIRDYSYKSETPRCPPSPAPGCLALIPQESLELRQQ